jgi:hypothetical protein
MMVLALRVQREPMIRAAALAIACLVAAMLLASPAQAGPQGASGNNGTVKIHEGADEPSPEVQNQPHVCTFHLHFFFGDAAQSGDWWIQSWPPTGDRSTVLAGTYTTDANGEDRDPDAGAYDLPDGHYKLFWEGATNPGGQTNIKHKVFWVDCPVEVEGGGGNLGGGNGGNGGGGVAAGGAARVSGGGVLAGAGGPGPQQLPDTSTAPQGAAGPLAMLLLTVLGATTLVRWRAAVAHR